MTNQETLEKAIQIAIENGWSRQGLTDEGKIHFTDNWVVVDWLRGGRDFIATETIIYNHEFAKALWGDVPYDDYPYGDFKDTYKYHLQEMVISPDPIKYLADNLPE